MLLKVSLKKLIMAVIYFIFALSIEFITFTILNLGTPKYLFFDISIILFLTAILFVIPGIKGQIVLSTVFLVVQVLVCFLNSVLYKVDGAFFSIDMIQVGGEGIAAFDFTFINISFTIILLSMVLVFTAALILINKFIKTKGEYKISFIITLITVCVSMQFLSFGLFRVQESAIYPTAENKGNIFLDDSLLYDTLEIKHEALKKFGTFGFYYKDFQNTFSSAKMTQSDAERLKGYLTYSDSDKSVSSPYHGISDGNNVIMVMCESLEWYAISEALTPNIYNLQYNNIFNDKFYSNNKTNVSEALAFLGNYPKKTAFSKDYKATSNGTDFSTPYSLPNILKQESYTSRFFHDYEGSFYGRSSTHTNIFGFDEFIDMYDMGNPDKYTSYVENLSKKFGDWILDSEMFNTCINDIAPDDGSNFFSFLTTVGMHGPYDSSERLESYASEIKNYLKQYNRLPNIDLSKFNAKQKEQIIYYIAAVMDLDKGIGILIDHLEKTGLIENTTVIIYADHWAYYQDLNFLAKDLPTTELYNPELYRIPFIMVDKKLQQAINKNLNENSSYYNLNTYMSAHDIMPTLLDLLGYTYNNKIFLGKSVLLEEIPYSCLVSGLSGFYNDRLFTYNGIDFLYEADGVTDKEKEEFLNYLVDFINKQSYIELIYMVKDSNISFSYNNALTVEKTVKI